MKQNPFSLYDFLGYFIPGIVMFFALIIIPICKEVDNITVDVLLCSLPTLKFEGIIFVIICSYILGHILSFFSSITVEKYSVWRYGYPSRYLLRMKDNKFSAHFKTFHGCFWGGLIITLLLPTILLDYLIGRILNFKAFYVKPLDQELSKIIKFKINTLIYQLGIVEENGFKEGGGNTSDFFRIIQHYTFENSKNHLSKFTNYIALFGFLRTMTFIMNILFWYLVVHCVLISEFNTLSLITIVLVSLTSYIFFMAFMKFYRRYTLEGFMVLVVDKEIK